MRAEVGTLVVAAAFALLLAGFPVRSMGQGISTDSSQDHWMVDPQYSDPQNGVPSPAASVTNGQGWKLAIFRSDPETTWFALTAPPDIEFDVKPVGDWAEFNVDGEQAGKTSFPGLALFLQPWKSKSTIKDLAWAGRQSSPPMGLLRKIMDGKTLTARVFQQGNVVEATFDLSGANAAVVNALKIRSKPTDAEAKAASDAVAGMRLVFQGMIGCQNLKPNDSQQNQCLKDFDACRGEQIAPAPIPFRKCLDAHHIPIAEIPDK